MLGNIGSLIDESLPPKPQWNVDQIPDLTGKVIIVTGGNAGVGKETVKALLMHNAKVYLAARSYEKASTAIDELLAVTGKQAIFLQLDLANLGSIKATANEFLSKETKLHVLFNNAGVMVPPIGDTTVDGYDLQFGTNVLGHFYFTKLLTPILLDTAKSSPEGKVRVVNVSSSAHTFVSSLDFSTFKDGDARKKVGTQKLYAQSKFGNVVYAAELARRYGDQGIVSTSLNPGNIRTELQRHISGIQSRLIDLVLYPPPMGALTQLWAGTSPEGAQLNGQYLKPWARVGKAISSTQDPELGKELWAWLEEQVKSL